MYIHCYRNVLQSVTTYKKTHSSRISNNNQPTQCREAHSLKPTLHHHFKPKNGDTKITPFEG